MALTEQGQNDRPRFNPGEVVYWRGKKYRVFDYVKRAEERRWLRDSGGNLKIADCAELRYSQDGDA